MKRLLFVLLFSLPACGQIALLSHTVLASPATTTSAINTTGATLLTVCSIGAAPYSNPVPTDSANNTWTLAANYNGAYIYASLWFVVAPITSTSHTVTFHAAYPGGQFSAFSNVASGPDKTSASGDASTEQASGTMTPANANELIVSCLGGNGSGTVPSVQSPLTLIDAATVYGGSGANEGAAAAYQVQTTATAVNPTWNIGGLGTSVASASFYATSAPATLVASAGDPPEGFVGSAYSYQLQATGGVGPFTWSLTSGTLPIGITLRTAGVLASSGSVASASTTGGLVFRVTDAQSHVSIAAAKTLTIAANALTMPTTCASGTQYTVYVGCNLSASGGTSPYTYAWLADSAHVGIPEGLILDTSIGAISGTVTGSGEYDTTFTATDSAGAIISATIPMHIAGNYLWASNIFFPSDHFLHGYDISQLPVDNSPATPGQLPGTVQLVGGHYVQNGGIPLNYASGTQAYIPINCTPPNYVCEADSGPFSAATAIEGTANTFSTGADSHGIVIQAANGSTPAKLFDTWRAFYSTSPVAWNAVSIDQWDLSGANAYKWVNGRVGADAAGLPIGAMVPTYDEVMSTAGYKRLTRMAFAGGNQFDYWVWPAQSTSPGYGGGGACSGGFVDNSGNGNHLLSQANPPTSCGGSRSVRIPLGEIYRIKASYTLPTCLTDGSSPQAAKMEYAWAHYGGINSDLGSFPQFILTPDDRWNDADLACLNEVPGSAWEPVNVSSLIRYDSNGYPLSMQIKSASTIPYFSTIVIGGNQ